MLSTPSRSHPSNAESPSLVETPVHRYSRRLLGLTPEFNPLQDPAGPRLSTTAMATATPSQVTLQHPMVPECFHGDAIEDVQDWLDQFERVASHNEWGSRQKLSYVYFALRDSARTWFVNRERSLTTWDAFRTQLLDTFTSSDRKDNAQRLLESRVQKPNESVAMFAEDMARLFHRADPEMAEEKKLRYLLRGVKEQLFAGLVRNPPTTVAEFTKEATAIERALQQRYRQYDRANSPTNASLLPEGGGTSLREVIREIVREEIRQLGIAPMAPAVASVADVVREEVRQAFSSPDWQAAPRRCTYAEALCRPPPATSMLLTPSTTPTQPPPPSPTPYLRQSQPPPAMPYRRQPIAAPRSYGEFPAGYPLRKTDLWRTADRRPLCFHCGEAGHVYRACHYRAAGFPRFPTNYSYPRFDAPRTCDDNPSNFRPEGSTTPRSRSPSPARYTQPTRRDFPDASRGRSPSPRRGN